MKPLKHPCQHANETEYCDAMRAGIDSVLTWVVDIVLDDVEGSLAWAVAAGTAVTNISGTNTAAMGVSSVVTESDVKRGVVAAAASLPSGVLPTGVCWLDVLLVVGTTPFRLGRVIGARSHITALCQWLVGR